MKNKIHLNLHSLKIFRSSILYFTADPGQVPSITDAIVYYEDGLLLVKDSYIIDVGDYHSMLNKYSLELKSINTDYIDKLIMPGFIDTHIHYPQTEMIGSFGEKLLPWLNNYTFPVEKKFNDTLYCEKIADFFIKELLRNGTTTALVFATVHPQSVDAIFKSADSKKMRLIAGKVMMDRNAPDTLLDTAESSFYESEILINKWHNKNRLLYAITPRFAPTSTPEQLLLAGKLKEKYPSTYIHTHLSENEDEIDWVKSLFPEAENYLDVYKKAGLVTPNSIFAHAIHLEDEEYETLYKQKASVSFCPTSNLFLGSGLFKIRKMKNPNRKIRMGIGTDIGAGTTFSMLRTLQEAYKVISLEQNHTQSRTAMSALEGFYQATLGGANALNLNDKIGKLVAGYEADFIVLDFEATPLQSLRMQQSKSMQEGSIEKLIDRLFALMIMGDDRNIVATYVNGEKVF